MNQKGFANIILVVVIVVLVGVVGYFAFVKKSEPVVQQPTPTPTQTKTPASPTPTPTSQATNLKTYTNTQYGFELKYPNDWPAPQELKNPGLGIRYEYAFSFMNEFNPPLGKRNKGFAIEVYKIPPEALKDGKVEGNELAMIVDQLAGKPSSTYPNCSGFKDVFIGQNNYSAIETYIRSDNSCYRETYFFSIQKGNYIYNIVPQPEGGNDYAGYDGKIKTEESLPEFSKILTSFKFTK
jgi:hypothetical protein